MQTIIQVHSTGPFTITHRRAHDHDIIETEQDGKLIKKRTYRDTFEGELQFKIEVRKRREEVEKK